MQLCNAAGAFAGTPTLPPPAQEGGVTLSSHRPTPKSGVIRVPNPPLTAKQNIVPRGPAKPFQTPQALAVNTLLIFSMEQGAQPIGATSASSVEAARSEVWRGHLPTVFTLAPDEVATVHQPRAFAACLPRQTLLPFVCDAVRRHFEPFGPPMGGKLWFAHEGTPLRWQLPVGVLFDLLVGLLDWNPADRLGGDDSRALHPLHPFHPPAPHPPPCAPLTPLRPFPMRSLHVSWPLPRRPLRPSSRLLRAMLAPAACDARVYPAR